VCSRTALFPQESDCSLLELKYKTVKNEAIQHNLPISDSFFPIIAEVTLVYSTSLELLIPLQEL